MLCLAILFLLRTYSYFQHNCVCLIFLISYQLMLHFLTHFCNIQNNYKEGDYLKIKAFVNEYKINGHRNIGIQPISCKIIKKSDRRTKSSLFVVEQRAFYIIYQKNRCCVFFIYTKTNEKMLSSDQFREITIQRLALQNRTYD